VTPRSRSATTLETMQERDWLAARFEAQRPRLRSVAFRILGSTSDAGDAVQEAWIRLNRSKPGEIDNLEAWLVTVVGRISLNTLRSRRRRHEEPLDAHRPGAIVERARGVDPEHEALLADSVGIALHVVLETLTPAERLAYVLHDMFSVAFDDIGAILDRSPEAARQLASRARGRIRDTETNPASEITTEQHVVESYLAAARHGDFDALVAVLDPDVVLRTVDARGGSVEVCGAERVARRATAFAKLGLIFRPALVNGSAGWVAFLEGRIYSIGAVTVRHDRIANMDIARDAARIADLDITGVASRV
jgi:RNA polymerase sigma factor (sigma-70 family)